MDDSLYKRREDFLMDNVYDEEKTYRDDIYRQRIRKILEDRFKSGSGYHDSLPYKYGKKADRYIKKRRYGDPMQEYMRRHKGGKKASKNNPWIAYLKEFRKENPELSGRQVMQSASRLYWQNKGNKAKRKKCRVVQKKRCNKRYPPKYRMTIEDY